METDMDLSRELVDGIPLLWVAPPVAGGLLIHVPAFGQAKEAATPVLEAAVSRGLIAVAIDAYQHGERGTEDRETLTRRVFSNFRREMWTIIGETVLDMPRVATWARARFGSDLKLHLTGLSMGGDVAVAAAPLFDAIASVNAVIATPDWQRPGMRDLKTDELVDQGEPDAKAMLFFDVLEPLSHADRYTGLPIHFINGAADRHVPPDGARRFKALVGEAHNSIVITEKPEMGHLDFIDPKTWLNDLKFGF